MTWGNDFREILGFSRKEENKVTHEEVKCPFCSEIYYLNTFRLQEAKSTTCLYCKKRFLKNTRSK